MGGPSINPIDPLLHIRCSSRDAARSVAIVVKMRERADAMLSIVGSTAILYGLPRRFVVRDIDDGGAVNFRYMGLSDVSENLLVINPPDYLHSSVSSPLVLCLLDVILACGAALLFGCCVL